MNERWTTADYYLPELNHEKAKCRHQWLRKKIRDPRAIRMLLGISDNKPLARGEKELL